MLTKLHYLGLCCFVVTLEVPNVVSNKDTLNENISKAH